MIPCDFNVTYFNHFGEREKCGRIFRPRHFLVVFLNETFARSTERPSPRSFARSIDRSRGIARKALIARLKTTRATPRRALAVDNLPGAFLRGTDIARNYQREREREIAIRDRCFVKYVSLFEIRSRRASPRGQCLSLSSDGDGRWEGIFATPNVAIKSNAIQTPLPAYVPPRLAASSLAKRRISDSHSESTSRYASVERIYAPALRLISFFFFFVRGNFSEIRFFRFILSRLFGDNFSEFFWSKRALPENFRSEFRRMKYILNPSLINGWGGGWESRTIKL